MTGRSTEPLDVSLRAQCGNLKLIDVIASDPRECGNLA